MNLKWTAAVAVGALAITGATVVAVRTRAESPTILQDQKHKVSYGMGVAMARSFQRDGSEIDVDALARGLRDVFSGRSLLMSEEDLRLSLGNFQTELKQRYVKAMKDVGEANKKQGDAFLASNATAEGVTTLPSGLQYKILVASSGLKPTDEDTVEVSYQGTRLDGTEFDSSRARGRATLFKLGGLIPGLKEGLKLMSVGSKWQLVVPPQLAYGEQGVPGKSGASPIGPNATLVFDVELVAIRSTGVGTKTAAVTPKASAGKR